LYEKLGSNELDKVAQRTCQFIVRSGKSTYLVNAQKLSTVTYITALLSVSSMLPVPIPDMLNSNTYRRLGLYTDFVFSGQTAIAE